MEISSWTNCEHLLAAFPGIVGLTLPTEVQWGLDRVFKSNFLDFDVFQAFFFSNCLTKAYLHSLVYIFFCKFTTKYIDNIADINHDIDDIIQRKAVSYRSITV